MKAMNEKRSNKWLWIGGAGAGIAALCCFTPILVLIFGLLGAGSLVVYLDSVLWPLLLVFVLLAVYGLWRRKPTKEPSAE